MKNTEFYKIEDVCELLQVSKITVYRWVKSGKMPAYKVGKAYLFKIKDVHELIEKSRVDYEQ